MKSGWQKTLLPILHLTVLWNFALAQPLYAIFSQRDHLAFFTAHQSHGLEIILLTLLLSLLVPVGLGYCLQRLPVFIKRWVEPIVFYILILLILLPPSKALFHDTLSTLLVACAASGVLGWFIQSNRFFLTLLTPSILIFPLIFLLISPVRKLVFPKVIPSAKAPVIKRQVPIVLVILDELPTSSLLNARQQIDPIRYPNFSKLAATSTWYPNATTVADRTAYAVPIILSSQRPTKFRSPTHRGYPDNLFTLLSDTYTFKVFETVTHLCPEKLCANLNTEPWIQTQLTLYRDISLVYQHLALPDALTQQLPPVSQDWAHFGATDIEKDIRPLSFQRFIQNIQASNPKQSLYAIHVELPHGPWRYLPSGKSYDDGFETRIDVGTALKIKSPKERHVAVHWGSEWFAQQAWQRHLLQLSYTDTWIGQMLKALEKAGIRQSAMIIVVADHGVHFTAAHDTRAAKLSNAQDIMSVPLLIHYPGQTQGQICTIPAETTDILPTIADVLDITIPFHVDGVSLLAHPFPERPHRTIYDRDRLPLRVSQATLDQQSATLKRKLKLFGDGKKSLYHFGPAAGLIGTTPESHPKAQHPPACKATFENAHPLESVHLNRSTSRYIPTRLYISLKPISKTPSTLKTDCALQDLALVLNGKIAAISQTGNLPNSPTQYASFLLPESTLHPGKNTPQVYEVQKIRNHFYLRLLVTSQ